MKLDCGYRMDLWFPGRLVVELKSVEVVLPVHEAQLLTYLRLAPCELGLLINFDVPVLKDGVKRMVWTADRYPITVARCPDETWADELEPLASEVCAAAAEVHGTLGPGLLRSAYEECMCHELAVRKIPFERSRTISIRLHDVEIADAGEIPLLVGGRLPVDCVSAREVTPLHEARLSARLKQGGWQSGLLLNFNVKSMSNGTRQIRNNRTTMTSSPPDRSEVT